MKIIFVEFHWQVNQILKDKEKYKNDMIISLYHETSYSLMHNGIKYFESNYFCKHEKLWEKYKDITIETLNISKILDQALLSTDDRFNKLNWDFFNDYHYALKLTYDQIYYYCELIYQIIKENQPSEIWVADTKEIKLNSKCLIHPQASVLKFLLRSIKNKNIKINYMTNVNKKKDKNIFKEAKKKIYEKFKNFLLKVNFLYNYYFFRSKYISVNCHEVTYLKKLYPKYSKEILSYKHENLNDGRLKKNWELFKEFSNKLKKDDRYTKIMSHRGINFELIFNEILLKLTMRLDFFISEYDKLKKIVNNLKPLSVIFQTTTPSYSPNIIFRKICKDLKIPFITWTHGGGGLTKSLLHYDVTDYRISNNLISRGIHLREIFKDETCVLNKLKLQSNIKVFSIGSPTLDYNYKKYFFKNNKKKEKPIITFVAGSYQMKNRYYFGYNREKATNPWLIDYKILNLLKNYQEKYQIIFKDYPHIGSPNLWRKVLKDIDAKNISYISDEKHLFAILNNSDLIVLPSMSSTFFDALYFDADIFVLEEDVFEKPFEHKLKNEIFYFKDDEKFKLNLKKYLNQGKFYQKKKINSRNYFLNFKNFNNRDKLLKETLNFISKN